MQSIQKRATARRVVPLTMSQRAARCACARVAGQYRGNDREGGGGTNHCMFGGRKRAEIAAPVQRQFARQTDIASAELRALGRNPAQSRRRHRCGPLEVNTTRSNSDATPSARCQGAIEFAAGIVDEGSYWTEPVEKLRKRAADWARVVGEERIWLAPSCGFGRHPARDVPVLGPKPENMMEAARTC